MGTELVGEFFQLARYGISAWLFTIAGVIMVVSRPAWYGSWFLLSGAIVASGVLGVRLLGLVPAEASVWTLVGVEAAETLGYVLTGTGALLISMRARARPGDRRLQSMP